MQTQKPYKTKLRHDIAENLEKCIDELLAYGYTDDNDRLVMCALAEIKQKLYMKLYKPQTEYTLALTPTQAIAVRILFTDFVTGHTSYLGNKLHLMANEIKQQYNF